MRAAHLLDVATADMQFTISGKLTRKIKTPDP